MNNSNQQNQQFVPPPMYAPQPQYVPQQYAPQMYYPPAEQDNTKLIVMATLGVLGMGLVGYGIYSVSGVLSEKQQEDYANKLLDGNPDTKIVSKLYSSLYPNGILSQAFGSKLKGKDAENLLVLAAQIKDFDYVKKTYNNAGEGKGRNLLDDLRDRLEPSIYAEFVRRATHKNNNGEGKVTETQTQQDGNLFQQGSSFTNIYLNAAIILNQSANIRVSPKQENGLINNVLVPMSKTKAGNVVGIGTGKKFENGYIEVYVNFDKKNAGVHQHVYYDGKNYVVGKYVYVHESVIYKPSNYTDRYGYTAPSEAIQGIIATSRKTIIYDDKMRGLGMAKGNIKLGELAYTLHEGNTKNVLMYGFNTPNGLRWVRSQDTFTL